MSGRPHGEPFGDLVCPAREAAVSAGAVEHEQRIAAAAHPRVHVDARNPDHQLGGLHGAVLCTGNVRAQRRLHARRTPRAISTAPVTPSSAWRTRRFFSTVLSRLRKYAYVISHTRPITT